jgi:hypothetical protein
VANAQGLIDPTPLAGELLREFSPSV